MGRKSAILGGVEVDGVIKFVARHEDKALADEHEATFRTLAAWRTVFWRLGVVGQDPLRYGGAGYGNLSMRVGSQDSPRGARPMLISGTQTGGLGDVGLQDFCMVSRYDPDTNSVDSLGLRHPSSESLTHGAVYDLSQSVRCVFHVHCPQVWRARERLAVPATEAEIPYGTPAMAAEVARLYSRLDIASGSVFAMAGHEDGIVSFGPSAKVAGTALVSLIATSYELH